MAPIEKIEAAKYMRPLTQIHRYSLMEKKPTFKSP